MNTVIPKPLKKPAMAGISTVSQWIEKGGLSTGWSLLGLEVVEARAKAVAVMGHKWNTSATATYPTKMWFPLSQLIAVADDFYQHKTPGQNYLAPQWLVDKKAADGFEWLAVA